MAGNLKIRSGTRLKMAYDVPVGKEPSFKLVCTFYKSLDESAFLISIPMVEGKPLILDENQKLLIQYGSGDSQMIVAGYADDLVKEGIRSYWKIRRVQEQRQFFQRVDERLKVALRINYYQDTWPMIGGKQDIEDGMTLDISYGGAAVYLNRNMDVGEVCYFSMPRIGTTDAGRPVKDIVAQICWMREAPKGSIYRKICGLQFRFGDDGMEREKVKSYIDCVKKRYKL